MSIFSACRSLIYLCLTANVAVAQEAATPGPAIIPATTPTPAPAPPPYHLAATWKVPGDEPWGALAVDSSARRLYVARQNSVQVLDTDKGDFVGEVSGLDGVRGVALAPRSGRGCVVSGKTIALVIFDLKTLERVGEPIPVGTEPDAVVYVPWREKIFVFNRGSRDATVIDAKEGKVISTIPLEGRPASAVAEGGGRVFVNLENKNEVAVIDVETLAIENRHPLKTGKRPAGISLDPDGGRLFISCGNERMLVMATEDGTIMGTVTIGKEVNTTGFDARTKLALAPDGMKGVLTVADAYRASTRLVGTLATKVGARTLAVDQRTHAVYLAAADFAPVTEAGKQPAIVPGSFVVLRYDYDGPRK